MQPDTLCLDFANTVEGTRARPRESLNGYADLVAWARAADLVTDERAETLLATAARRPAAAATALATAISLREAIYRLCSAIAAGRPVADDDVATLNQGLAAATPHHRLTASDADFAWEWAGVPDDLDRPWWPVAWSAARVLSEGPLDRLRECDSETCAWLFMDHSRNRSRRWCAMSDCGNRAKARRHYARQRAARGGDGPTTA